MPIRFETRRPCCIAKGRHLPYIRAISQAGMKL